MSFAQKLDSLMTTKGTSMYRLAKELNVHQTTIKNWLTEHTEPKKQELIKMAEYFSVSLDELLDKEKAPAEGEGLTSLDKTIIDLMHSLPLEEELRWYSGSMFCYNKGSNVYHTHNCSLLNKTKPFYLKFWSEVDNMQKCQYCIPG